MNHLQIALTDAGLVLELTQTRVGPPIAATHLLLLVVRLVTGVGTVPRPLVRDNIGVNSIMVGVSANTIVDLL